MALRSESVISAAAAPRDTRASGDDLPRCAPHDVGVDADAVLAYLDDMQANGLELDSFMLARHGSVAAEGWWWPYRPDLVHMLHSATKSFTATGIGIAIAEGRLNPDDPVLKFFPGRVRQPSANLDAMTVKNLLTQTSGHERGISGSAWRPIATSWVDEFFKVPVTHEPGTLFTYSSATSFMLSAIVNQVTGESLHDYMKPRFFDPLGITTARWDVGPENINPGGNGLSTTTSDFLKLGLVYLAGGEWKGRPVLSREWTQAATAPKFHGNHGYHWWVWPNPLCYSADGKFGQFCFVFPGLDAVLVTTAGVPDNLETREKMHAIAFKHIVKMCPPVSVADSESGLAERVHNLRVLPPLLPRSSALAGKISGRTFVCAPNADAVKSIKLTFAGGSCQFELTDDRGSHAIDNGLSDWIEGETTMTGHYLHHEYQPQCMPVIAGGRWGEPNRFDMTWQFIETAFRDTASMTFDGDTVRFDRRVNVNSGALHRPTIVATAT
ncbi:MAG TPA: serine hydrolase [Rhizomicrobium sp.]|nr:serine hydrolase [Rhizomicrobium sp.]